jgi:hypothetical protein
MMEREGENDIRPTSTLGHLMAGGVLLPAQLPSSSAWSAERRLAAAVLASALLEVRGAYADRDRRRMAGEDLEWIFSDDTSWPFSFLPLCQVLSIEPEYLRGAVRKWMGESTAPCPRSGQACAA